MRRHAEIVLVLVLLGSTLASPARAVVFDDAGTYHLQQVWSAPDLGIPAGLGGLMFSSDGSTLYAVGNASENTSALYALGVDRDPVTHVVTGLQLDGVAFMGQNPDPGPPPKDAGLDAGIDFDPPGSTLFYSYHSADTDLTRIVNQLAERPGGVAGVETTWDLTSLFDGILPGFPASMDGLAFSEKRIDVDTGFGFLQVSTGLSRRLFEISLAPAGPGLFAPDGIAIFVTFPQGEIAAIHYIPAGALQGHLMHANTESGELRVLHIDPASGDPIDQDFGPLFGTTNPVDDRFASDLDDATGGGPVALEFDPITDDLFVGTFDGNPPNSILRICGFGAGACLATTTSTTSTTSTSTSTSSTSTTSTSSSSTSTTSTSSSSTTSTSTSSTSTTSTSTTSTTSTSTSSTSSTTSTTLPTCEAGECNDDASLTTADVTCLILRLFDQIPQASECEDCNGDGVLTTADVTCVILCLFGSCP